MNAPFDTLEFAARIKATKLGKDGADTLARAMADVAMRDLVTTQALKEAIAAQTTRMTAVVVSALTLATAILAALISLK